MVDIINYGKARDLHDADDKFVLKIWKLAIKAFATRDPHFLDDISDYIHHTKWD